MFACLSVIGLSSSYLVLGSFGLLFISCIVKGIHWSYSLGLLRTSRRRHLLWWRLDKWITVLSWSVIKGSFLIKNVLLLFSHCKFVMRRFKISIYLNDFSKNLAIFSCLRLSNTSSWRSCTQLWCTLLRSLLLRLEIFVLLLISSLLVLCLYWCFILTRKLRLFLWKCSTWICEIGAKLVL